MLRGLVERWVTYEVSSGKTVGEIIQTANNRYIGTPDASKVNYDVILDEMAKSKRMAGASGQADFSSSGRARMFFQRYAEFLDYMGDEISPEAMIGFIRTYDRLIPDNASIPFNADRYDDLGVLFKADTTEGKKALRESLEQFKSDTDLNAGAATPFKVSSRITNVYPTMYHYANDGTFSFMKVQNGKIIANSVPSDLQRYVTPDSFNSTTDAMDKLQLPYNGPATARYRFTFKSAQSKDDFRMPYGNDIVSNGNGYNYSPTEILEPTTKQNPNYGSGGGKQLIQNVELEIDEIFDYVKGRNLSIQEIETLISNSL